MLWIKIAISVLAVTIPFVEFYRFKKRTDNRRWEKAKRPIIVISSFLLLLLTVWGEIVDNNENQIEEERRNRQIVKDSLRASRIITNLESTLIKIDSTAQNLDKVDSSIVNVNNVLNSQVNQLSSVVSKSKEVQKNLTGGNGYLKLYLVKLWRTQTLELRCSVMGKYPMSNVNIYITCSSFLENISNKTIEFEPMIQGNGSNMAFDVYFSSITPNRGTYTIATFESKDFEDDIELAGWTYSNNGSTFQKIRWENHKEYLKPPRKTGTAKLTDIEKMDWTGKGFEYSSFIHKVTPVESRKRGNKVIDSTAGFTYYDNYMIAFNLFNLLLIN